MKKTIKQILSIASVLIFGLIVVGCSEKNTLDLRTYFKTSVTYKVNNSKDSGTMDLDYLISDEPTMDCYTVIQISSNKNWTYGLTLEKFEFDVIMSEVANLDIDLTISNLQNAENYNKTTEENYYHKTLSFNKLETHVTLDINDIIQNKASVLSFEVVDSCYKTNPNLTFAITNLKMSGYHQEANY